MQSLSKLLYGATKRVLRYLKGISSYDIWYTNANNHKLLVFLIVNGQVQMKVVGVLQAMFSILVQGSFHRVQRSRNQLPYFLRG